MAGLEQGEINRDMNNLDSFLPHLMAILVPCEFDSVHLADCAYCLLHTGDLFI
jgi:hypothetical protein